MRAAEGIGDRLLRKALCDRFQPYDRAVRRHLEYLLDRGAHADVPVADIMAIFAREYPRLVERGAGEPATRFREEAR